MYQMSNEFKTYCNYWKDLTTKIRQLKLAKDSLDRRTDAVGIGLCSDITERLWEAREQKFCICIAKYNLSFLPKYKLN